MFRTLFLLTVLFSVSTTAQSQEANHCLELSVDEGTNGCDYIIVVAWTANGRGYAAHIQSGETTRMVGIGGMFLTVCNGEGGGIRYVNGIPRGCKRY